MKTKHLICKHCESGIVSSTGKISKEKRAEFKEDHLDCPVNYPIKKKKKSLYERFLKWINSLKIR